MKIKDQQTVAILISIIVVIGLLVFQYFLNNRRVEALQRRLALETAKSSFLMQTSHRNAVIDSIHTHNDTISFFSNDSLVGRSVVSRE